jgi:sugar porter (SP) family MFS transporter
VNSMNAGINPRLALSFLAGALCGLLFGYDIGAISSATQWLRAEFALSPSALGVVVSAALWGTIVGSLIAGAIADALDRRNALLIAVLLYGLSAICTALVSSFDRLLILRFFCGVGIGLLSVVAPMYLAEISPPNLRGRLVGSFQIAVGAGVVVAFAANYDIARHFVYGGAWRWCLGCGAVPALLCGSLLFAASPSPRWLALQRRFAECETTLRKLGSADPDADQASLLAAVDTADSWGRQPLFARRNLRPILLAAALAVFNQLSGVNVLLYYVLDIFTNLGSGQLNGRKDAVLVAAMGLAVTLIAVSVMDCAGRKPLLLLGTAGMSMCLALLAAIHRLGWPAWSVVAVFVGFNAFFAFSQGTVLWVYLSEIFPLPMRARGQSLGSTVHWISNAVITGSFPVIASYGTSKVFLGFAAMLAAQFLIILVYFPETKRIGLEALAAKFSRQDTAQ